MATKVRPPNKTLWALDEAIEHDTDAAELLEQLLTQLERGAGGGEATIRQGGTGAIGGAFVTLARLQAHQAGWQVCTGRRETTSMTGGDAMKWSTEQKVRDAIRFGDGELLAEAVQGDRFLDYDELEQFVGEQVGGYLARELARVKVGATTVVDSSAGRW